jgi:hypothetical protein
MKFFKPIYTEDYEAIIPFRGQKYSVEIEIIYEDYGMPTGCAILDFKKLSESADISVSSNSRSPLVKWGGSPRFIQDEYYPIADDGTPYDFLCTVENSWGDSGNCNIFILVEERELGDSFFYEIKDVFVEASCC